MDNEMRIQTDQEFELSKVKRLNKKCKVHMFSLKVHGSKAFAAEQKIREFDKLPFKTKALDKSVKENQSR